MAPKEPRKPSRCQVCKAQEFKYRCPTCRLIYCSVPCYRHHKSGEGPPCVAPTQDTKSDKKLNRKRVWEDEDDDDEDETRKLSEEQVRLLRGDKRIRAMVRDEELRDIVRRIDKASDPVQELGKWMGDPRFVAFVDEMLDVIGFRERENRKEGDGTL